MKKFRYLSVTNQRWIKVYAVFGNHTVQLLDDNFREVKTMGQLAWNQAIADEKVKEGWED